MTIQTCISCEESGKMLLLDTDETLNAFTVTALPHHLLIPRTSEANSRRV